MKNYEYTPRLPSPTQPTNALRHVKCECFLQSVLDTDNADVSTSAATAPAVPQLSPAPTTVPLCFSSVKWSRSPATGKIPNLVGCLVVHACTHCRVLNTSTLGCGPAPSLALSPCFLSERMCVSGRMIDGRQRTNEYDLPPAYLHTRIFVTRAT